MLLDDFCVVYDEGGDIVFVCLIKFRGEWCVGFDKQNSGFKVGMFIGVDDSL